MIGQPPTPTPNNLHLRSSYGGGISSLFARRVLIRRFDYPDPSLAL